MPEDLKARIASAAERAGKTTHSFILEAIAEKAEREELRADFDAEADARFAKIVSSGETIPWSDMGGRLFTHVAAAAVAQFHPASARPVIRATRSSCCVALEPQRHPLRGDRQRLKKATYAERDRYGAVAAAFDVDVDKVAGGRRQRLVVAVQRDLVTHARVA
jgi:predicted transcriptional regulator